MTDFTLPSVTPSIQYCWTQDVRLEVLLFYSTIAISMFLLGKITQWGGALTHSTVEATFSS